MKKLSEYLKIKVYEISSHIFVKKIKLYFFGKKEWEPKKFS